MLNGHPTIAEAAAVFSVSAKTVREWINKGVIPQPPTIQYGLKEVMIFPDDYLDRAKKQLQHHRAQRRREREKKRKGD